MCKYIRPPFYANWGHHRLTLWFYSLLSMERKRTELNGSVQITILRLYLHHSLILLATLLQLLSAIN